jgi:hypothetical protein
MREQSDEMTDAVDRAISVTTVRGVQNENQPSSEFHGAIFNIASLEHHLSERDRKILISLIPRLAYAWNARYNK